VLDGTGIEPATPACNSADATLVTESYDVLQVAINAASDLFNLPHASWRFSTIFWLGCAPDGAPSEVHA